MYGLGIELPKGVSEPPAVNLTHDVSCRVFIENRPAADRISVRLSARPPEKKGAACSVSTTSVSKPRGVTIPMYELVTRI